MIFKVSSLFMVILILKEISAFRVALNETELKIQEEEKITLNQFEDFIIKYEKMYKDEAEKAMRYLVFKKNLKEAERLQSLEYGTAIYGITPLSDVTDEEFSRYYANFKYDKEYEKLMELATNSSGESDSEDFPDMSDEYDILGSYDSSLEQTHDVDWRKSPAPKVKDQKQCGSCWAFANSALLEHVHAKKTKKVLSFSDQQLVDCTYNKQTGNFGCDGGGFDITLEYMVKTGLVLTSDYPYTARDGKCKPMEKKTHYKLGSFKFQGKGEDKIQGSLKASPIAVGLSAKAVQLYTRGVMNPDTKACPKEPDQMDHAMLVVGCGTETVTVNKKKKTIKFYNVQNSWGTSFGEGGYVRMMQGTNPCGISSLAYTGKM